MQIIVFLFNGKKQKFHFSLQIIENLIVLCNYCREITWQNNVIQRSISYRPLVP